MKGPLFQTVVVGFLRFLVYRELRENQQTGVGVRWLDPCFCCKWSNGAVFERHVFFFEIFDFVVTV